MKHFVPRGIPRAPAFTMRIAAMIAAVLLSASSSADAQTDYYNTDAGRPLTVEDASATERYAFEWQLAPLRLERTRGGIYKWEVEPEIAYGILPRTQIEIGAPITYVDTGRGFRSANLAGLELSVLHNLNVETSLPALAMSGSVLLPVGGSAPDEAVYSAKAIATRTFRWARFHLNAQYSSGEDGATTEENSGRDISRWLAGVAVDRSFPLRSLLVGGEVFFTQPRGNDREIWNAAIGVRRQLSPAFTVDAGIGKQLSADRTWFVTLGLAHAFAIRSLLPGG